MDKFVASLLSQPQLGLRMTKKWLNQYLYQHMNIVGAGALAAESLVLASDEFAEAVVAPGKKVEQQKAKR